MKQKLSKGQSPTKPSVESKNLSSIASLLQGQASLTDIPSDCKKELDDAGLEARWIDLTQLQKNGGWHKKEWQPYKFNCKVGASANPFGGQAGAFDGYLVRQQMVLAAKTKEKTSLQRAQIALKTKLQSDPAALKLKEMQAFVKQSGVSAKITDESEQDDE